MEKVWACISNGAVENLIVAEHDFIASYSNADGARFDAIIRVDELTPRPEIGWLYANGEFSAPETN